MPEFKLPDVGEGLTEAEIVAWRVGVGDEVAINDVIVEIETAKSIVELPSPYAGTVSAILVPEGETVPVGTPIIAIGEPAAQPGDTGGPGETTRHDSRTGGPIDTNVPPEGNATLVGYGPKEAALKRRPRKVGSGAEAANLQTQASFEPGPSPAVESESGAAVPPGPGDASGAVATGSRTPAVEERAGGSAPVAVRTVGATPGAEPSRFSRRGPGPGGDGGGGVAVLAKPPVRKLAKDLGVDLASVAPSGPGGIVTRADVEAAATAAPVEVEEGRLAVRHETGETREPIKGVRKMMAAAMVESAFSAPHVTEWVTIDATATVELVERLRKQRELREVKVSPLLVVAKAVLLALRRSPLVNSTWDEAAGEVVVKHYVNLGIAAATPRGLVVPNVKDAHALDLADLARALEELTATAREGRTQPADMAGGTFTITNVGVFGVDGGTPIINPGESAILCMGAIKPQPWVVGDQVVPRQVMTLALSFDHRHIDGATGSRFLADVAAIVSDPATALMY